MKRLLSMLTPILMLIPVLFLSACELEPEDNDLLSDPLDESSTEKPYQFTPKKHLPDSRSPFAADVYEEDDLWYWARSLTSSVVQQHNFYDDPTDWTTFYAEFGQNLVIDTTVYGEADTVLSVYLYPDLTTPIAYNDDKGDGTYGSQIYFFAPEDGVYYVKCASLSGDIGPDNEYELIALPVEDQGDDFEQDDVAALAKPLISGYPQYHNFHFDPVDWVKIYMEAGQQYTMESQVSGADTVFRLYDSEAATNLLAINDDKNWPADPGSKIVYTATQTGYHYLEMRQYANAIGDTKKYSITLEAQTPPIKEWTFMILMGADNNLEYNIEQDIEEMLGIPLSVDEEPNINIIMLIDHFSESGKRDGAYLLNPWGRDGQTDHDYLELLVETGEINSGDPHIAMDFADYAVQNYPAKKYAWIFWNHGWGPDGLPTLGERKKVDSQIETDLEIPATAKGVILDETDMDQLTEPEQSHLLSHITTTIGGRLDILGYQACMMGAAEVAYQQKDFADYLFFSQTLMWYGTVDWDFIDDLKARPTMDARELSLKITEAYEDEWSDFTEQDVTFSVIELTQMGNMQNAVKNFVDAALAANAADKEELFQLKVSSIWFGQIGQIYIWDLKAYMDAIAGSDNIESPAIQSTAAIVSQEVEKVVLYEWHSDRYNQHPNGTVPSGLAVGLDEGNEMYSDLQFCKDTGWDRFTSKIFGKPIIP